MSTVKMLVLYNTPMLTLKPTNIRARFQSKRVVNAGRQCSQKRHHLISTSLQTVNAAD